MKAVVMAGGTGSRLRPMLADSINKHLCPVGGKPLIHWPLEAIADMGISEVFVMGNGPRFLPVMEEVGTGKQFGLRVSYVYDPRTAGQSVGAHLLDMEPYIDDEAFVLMLGDSVYLEPLPPPNGNTFQTWAMPVDETWDDIEKYAGVPGRNDLIQTGAWVLPKMTFDAIRDLSKARDLVRIRDIVKYMSGFSRVVGDLHPCIIKEESFIDCGTPEAVYKINSLLT